MEQNLTDYQLLNLINSDCFFIVKSFFFILSVINFFYTFAQLINITNYTNFFIIMFMKKLYIFLLFFSVISVALVAQVTIGSSLAPVDGALLDLKERASENSDNSNSNRGLLLPRVKLNSATDILFNAGEEALHTGLTVYHMGSQNLCAGVYVWDSSKWNRVMNPCTILTECGTSNLNGVYEIGTVLSSLSNTITLTINVPIEAVGGTYNIYTDTQNGMTFSGTGVLTKGSQTVTLNGSGMPKKGGESSVFTIYAEYSNSPISSTCSLTMPVGEIPIGGPRIFTFGYLTGTYGYSCESSASKAFLQSTNNFGTSATSTVKVSNRTMIPHLKIDPLSFSSFIQSSGFASDPDIIIHGYHSYVTSTNSGQVIDSLVSYLNRGGVLILLDEYKGANNITTALCKKLFPLQAAAISNLSLGGAGSAYIVSNAINDEITNGPFGDIRGLKWGEDASSTMGISGLPQDSIIVYTNGSYQSNSGTSDSSNSSSVSMFRHKRLNLFFIGDGGFLSNPSTTIGVYGSSTLCPFSIDANYRPIPRTGWGVHTVYNSTIFGNIMNWAMKNARSNNK